MVNDEVNARGFECKLGLEYAREETLNPRRILTTTVVVNNGVVPLLPVRSKEGLPKHLIRDAIRLLSKVTVDAPIRREEIIYGNILDTNIDIVASRSVERLE